MKRYRDSSKNQREYGVNFKKLDEIVRKTKKRKEVGVRYMKSWEIEQELLDEGRAEGLEVGREQQRMEDAETISGYQNQIATMQTEMASMQTEMASMQTELEALRARVNV